MARYVGQTFVIPCLSGGWNANPNTDLLAPEAMVDARNINLHRGGRETRGGTAKVNSTAISGNPTIMGLYQFIKRDGSKYLIAVTSDGKIIRNFTTELKTGLTVNYPPSFETFDDKLYIFIRGNPPQVWDGSAASTSDLTNMPSDWIGANYPAQVIKHGRGASLRLWATGCPDNPGRIYASANGTDDFSDANVTTIDIDTGDDKGIVGMIEFGENLLCFGRRQAYIIDDANTNTADWGYVATLWTGGTINFRTLCKVENDIVSMTPDGDIYSVRTVADYGDYKQASLIHPINLNSWIIDNVDLTKIENFHMIYDPNLKALKIFIQRKNQSQIDTALVFFVERGIENGWVRHDNTAFASGYNAACSCLVKDDNGQYKVYTGDYNGYVWELETDDRNDDGNYFYAGFKTPYLTFNQARAEKHYLRGWIVIRPYATETISINLWVDGKQATGEDFLVDENGNYIVDENQNLIVGSSGLLWQVTAAGATDDLQNLSYKLGLRGKRIQAEIYNQNVNEKFFISQLMFDFNFLGRRLE